MVVYSTDRDVFYIFMYTMETMWFKEWTITGLVIAVFIWFGWFISHKNLSPIEQLYAEKWTIVDQKSQLLSDRLEITMKIADLDYKVLDIDKKLSKLINPSTGTVVTGATADMDSFIQSQTWNSQKPQTWLVE